MFAVAFGPMKPELQTTPTRAFACADAKSMKPFPCETAALSAVWVTSVVGFSTYRQQEPRHDNDIYFPHPGSTVRI